MAKKKASSDTRTRILVAAAEMMTELPMSGLSVRAVAARAKVSTGSVRHFFPTQRQLLDTVVAGLYTLENADDPIHDLERSPEERLVACLQSALAQLGTGEEARANWRALYVAYADESLKAAEREQYLAVERVGIGRIERWIRALRDERSCSDDELRKRARFLAAVVSGIFTERVLPSEDASMEREGDTLRLAVKAVLNA